MLYVGQVPPTARGHHPKTTHQPTPHAPANVARSGGLLVPRAAYTAANVEDLFVHKAVTAGTATACTALSRLCWRCAALRRSGAARHAQPSCCNCLAPQRPCNWQLPKPLPKQLAPVSQHTPAHTGRHTTHPEAAQDCLQPTPCNSHTRAAAATSHRCKKRVFLHLVNNSAVRRVHLRFATFM
jgi:hypothetical protein